MKTLMQILKKRKLQIFFLLYVLMPVPVLSLLAQNLTLGTVAVGIGLSLMLLCVVFLLSSFMTTRGVKIFYSLLLAVTIIPGTILIGYLFIGDVLLSGGTITSIFETNTDEASEFIAYLNPWLVTAVTLFVLTPIVMIYRMKQPEAVCRIRRHKYAFFALVLMALLFVTVRPVAQRIYFVDFYRVFADYKRQRLREEKEIAERQTLPFDVSMLPEKAPQTLVAVIGESHTRHHMSLYGYGRDTNPLLSAQKSRLNVYRDVVSPQVHTIPVLRAALTFADHEHPEKLTEQPSLFELFNRAGYETYLISNQPFENSSSSYESLLRLAQHTTDLSRLNEPDGVMLKSLRQALQEQTNKPQLIVLHLMGSHIAYKYRYPENFEHFNHLHHPIGRRDIQLTADAKTVIDRYDNSVRYNDYLLASIIDMIKSEKKRSAMLYFSDHGEEVYDLREFAGHAYEKISSYMCEIPFILWMSDDYKQRRSDLVFDTKRPYSTVDVLYSLSDLGGLRYEGYDTRRSIFSAQFAPRPRIVGQIPYESVLDMTHEIRQKHRRTMASNTFFDNLNKEWKQIKSLSDKVLSSPRAEK